RSLIPAQGWSAATTLGTKDITELTLKALGLCANNPFRVETNGGLRYPGLSLRANPGLELANAFGVIVGIPACWNLANAFGRYRRNSGMLEFSERLRRYRRNSGMLEFSERLRRYCRNSGML